ncbi:MAG: hybrid sensor histidine kinase/response regulator [Proteobacteria bacterium]|nr:hybrid sensor histidine kinase/response regulator [Pseudomonadota bacterium]
MVRSIWNISSLSERGLLWRLFAAASVVVVTVAVALRIAIGSSFESVKTSELEVVMTAIESGPLQLARYHSTELATRALQDLFTRSGLSQRNFVSAKIATAGKIPSVYASWQQATHASAGCLSTIERSYHFEDAFEPFTATVTYDTCKDAPYQAALGWIIDAVALFTLLLTAVGAWLACRPLFTSLKKAAWIFDQQDLEPEDAKVVSYLPLREVVAKALESKVLEKQAAVARLTAMVAHDCKKPFSILKMGLSMLANVKDVDRMKSVLARLIPEVDRAVASVDGLLLDVMQISSTSTQLLVKEVAPESLIDSAIQEVARIYPKADVAISYDLKHTQHVMIDAHQINRCFSNIFSNAVQAMGQKGHVWFATRDAAVDGAGFVEFCIGNFGSYIPPESIKKLFSSFFTENKVGGTGLGLAIAHKSVTIHGGSICCKSARTAEYPQGKVEFVFTLPASAMISEFSSINLPANVLEVTKELLKLTETHSSTATGSTHQSELDLETQILDANKMMARSLRILIVDDEDVFRQSIAASLNRTPDLSNSLVIRMASGSKQALNLVAKSNYDLVICDVDMGAQSLNGFDLVADLHAEKCSKSLIAIHSNRLCIDDSRRALEAGADTFLSKPSTREQVLKLVFQAQKRVLGQDEAMVQEQAAASSRPEIMIVEDGPFQAEAFEDALKADATVHLVASPEALGALLLADPGILDRLTCAIVDMYYDGSSLNGLDVAATVKGKRAGLKVLLSSDGDYSGASFDGLIDHVIGKEPISMTDLKTRYDIH